MKKDRPIKKQKIVFTDYETCRFIVKTVKSAQYNTSKENCPDFKKNKNKNKKSKENQNALFV